MSAASFSSSTPHCHVQLSESTEVHCHLWERLVSALSLVLQASRTADPIQAKVVPI